MNNVEKFLSEVFGEVRAIKEGESIWFCASDVAKALGDREANRITRILDDEDKYTHNVGTAFGVKEMTFISESGLYEIILTKKPKSQEKREYISQFKKWITKEVIPTIRKTQGFVQTNNEKEFIDNYFSSFSEEVKLAMVQDLRQQNEILKPKAERFDKFLDSNKTYSFTDVAKLISTKATEEGLNIKISNQKLTELLREKSILTKDRMRTGFKNNPRKDYEEYFNVIVAHDKNGNTLNKTQTRVKPTGVDFIYKIVKENALAS